VSEVGPMVKRRLRVMLVCGCCLLSAAARGQPVGPGGAKAAPMSATDLTGGASSTELARTVQAIINLTNGRRQAEGLQPVRPNPDLMKAAQDFAGFMARTDQFGHTADGSSPAERAERHGYDACTISENIAYEYSPAEFLSEELAREFFQGWEHSADHRKNMLDPDVTEAGVAVARSERTGYNYAVQLFGRPTAEMLEFQITNETDTLISYTLGGQTFPLPPRSTRTHQRCQPDEITFQWPGTQEQTTVQARRGGHYAVVRDGNGRFTLRGA
jgi:uncharacterized protein YkwD